MVIEHWDEIGEFFKYDKYGKGFDSFNFYGKEAVNGGAVSMEGTRRDAYSVPLLLLKKGDVFGIEAFTTSHISSNGYKAVKNNTNVVEIPLLALANVINEHYEIIGELFEIMNKRLMKFERLWMME